MNLLEILGFWMIIIIFSLIFVPIAMAFFAKALGNKEPIARLIRRAYYIELHMFGRAFEI